MYFVGGLEAQNGQQSRRLRVQSLGTGREHVLIGALEQRPASQDHLETVDAGLLLEIAGTASGRVIHAHDTLSSSGTLVWETSASGASLWVSTFDGASLTDCDAATQKLLWDDTLNRFSCGTDDDVPESGDFGAAVDLEADGSLSADVVAAAEMADADHGDISWLGGVANIDANTVGQSEVAGNSLDFAELQEALDIDALTTITLGANDFTIIATSTGQFEIVGTASGRTIHAQDRLTSSGTLTVKGRAEFQGTLSGNLITGTPGIIRLSRQFSSGALVIGTGANTGIGIQVPAFASGYVLKSVQFDVVTAGTTNATKVNISQPDKGRTMLSTPVSVDSAEKSSITAATPAVVNTARDDVQGGETLSINVLELSTTAPKNGYLYIELHAP